jgi:hypothetical protein
MKLLCLLPLVFSPPLSLASALGPVVGANELAPALARQESVDALIDQGRAKLDAGDAAAAQALFDRAAELDKGSPKTRVWVLRGWIAQERINDAYNAIDELAKTLSGSDVDYLYGCAFATDARKSIATNQTGPFTGEKINDAVTYLARATSADPARYRDGLLLLCWACWERRDLDQGLAAATKACGLMPANAEAWYQAGRFELAYYQQLSGDSSKKDAAAARWTNAKTALDKAAALLAGDATPWKRSLLSRVEVDLGHALKWKDDVPGATAAYGRALALDPTLFNYAQVLAALGDEPFLAALEAGAKGFTATWGADNPADATLQWWLGWARLRQKQYKEAEDAFALSLKKFPEYTNCWFYIGLCRASRQDQAGAVEALLKHADANQDDLVATLQQNLAYHLAVLDSLVGFCGGKQRVLDAGRLSELQARAKPDEPRYWNNAGLFFRDAGIQKTETADEDRRAKALELWERAYVCYAQALSLTPDDPSILNDTAVMLHYYLDRDAERAKEMYKKAAAKAEELLARKDLSRDLRDLYEIALRDARNNLDRLERGIKTNG